MSVLKVTIALGTVLVGGTGTYLTYDYLKKDKGAQKLESKSPESSSVAKPETTASEPQNAKSTVEVGKENVSTGTGI